MSDSPHSALTESLAATLRVAKERYIVWTEFTLPVVSGTNEAGRADVFAFCPWWSRHDRSIYEIKVQRTDYLTDVSKGKYRKYLPFCNRLYFAVPKGLVRKTEVPDTAGLIVHGENGWRVVKSAPQRVVDDFSNDFLWHLIDECWFRDVVPGRDLKTRMRLMENADVAAMARGAGHAIGQRVGQLERQLRDGQYEEENPEVVARRDYAVHVLDAIEEMLDVYGIDHSGHRPVQHLAEVAGRILEQAQRLDACSEVLAHLHSGWHLQGLDDADKTLGLPHASAEPGSVTTANDN